MKKWLKNKKIYIINILTIITIFILVLLLNHTSPFGNNLLGKSDAIIQYKPFLFDFITKLKSGTLLNYSFNNGLGNPFTFNYIYYLASPLNLIAIFFKTPDAMYLSTIIFKLIIGSICITYYTKTKTNNNYIIFLTNITYLFCSYFVAYYFFLTWLDIFILFPLYQKGLENILEKNKFNLYIITLCLISICNIYLAFSIYIYTIIYFIFYLIYIKASKKEIINKFNLIALSTITSFIIIFGFIYICFDVFLKSGITFNEFVKTDYNITPQFLTISLFYGNISILSQTTGDTFPNISSNLFFILNIIFYLFNKKINKKDKIFAIIGILILISAVFIDKVNLVLNFFHTVKGFTFRYAYIFTFLGIKIFINNLKTIDTTNIKKLLLPLIIIIPLLIWSINRMEFIYIVINICTIISLIIVILLYQNNKLHKLLICLIICLESFFTLYYRIPEDSSKEDIDLNEYNKENVTYRLNYAGKSKTNAQNQLTYTTIFQKEEILNENLYYNSKVAYLATSIPYHSSTLFTSTIGCSDFLGNYIECPTEHKLANLLLNIKNDDNLYLEKIFAVNSNVLNIYYDSSNSAKNNLEEIIYGMTGITDIYDKITLKATREDEDNYYFETEYKYYQIEEKNDKGEIYTVPQTYSNFSIKKENGSNETIVYVPNQDKLEKIHDYLATNQIKYTSYNDNKIEGTINVNNNQMIYTSIPYDESWEIKIDDQIVQPTILFESLIGIEVSPGTHTISMEYKNTNYIGPFIVSGIALIAYILFNLKKKN